jgi:hypothetical protein
MRIYRKAILFVALVAVNCALASEGRNSSENAEAAEKTKPDYKRYARFDARLEAVPEDPAIAKSVEIEPLIRSLGVQLKPGVEAPDFDLPALAVKENHKGDKMGAIGNDTVRLSAFRGRKPVALTLSGST